MRVVSENIKNRVLTFLICLYPTLLIWQGVDLTDVGYSLSNYQQFFDNPESIKFSGLGPFFLTDFIGASFYKVFNGLGLIGFKIIGVVSLLITLFCYYNILKHHIQKTRLLGLMLIVMMFSYKDIVVINYNNLTQMFFAIAASLIYYSIRKEKEIYIILAGIILGFNVFIKLTNALGFLCLIPVIFYYFLLKDFNKIIKYSKAFLCGFVIGLVSIISLIKCMGYYNNFLISIRFMALFGNDKNSTHNFKTLIYMFIRENVQSVRMLVIFMLIIVLYYGIKKTKLRNVVDVIFIAMSSLILFAISYKGIDAYYIKCIYLFNGLIYGFSIVYIFNLNKTNSKEVRFLSLLGLLLVNLTPLGSDNGMHNSIFGIWLSGILTLNFLIGMAEKYFNKNSIFYKTSLFVIFIATTIYSYQYTYRDTSQRTKMRYSINNKYLKNVYTTKERAKQINLLLEELNKYVKTNDYLMAYGNIPLLNFITDTKPYLYSAWPQTYSKYQFKLAMKRAEDEIKQRPIVLISKLSVTYNGWPNYGIVEYDNKYSIFKDYIKRKKYKIIWQNKFFVILK